MTTATQAFEPAHGYWGRSLPHCQKNAHWLRNNTQIAEHWIHLSLALPRLVFVILRGDPLID